MKLFLLIDHFLLDLTLKSHAETRWESRLKAVKYQLEDVINALEELAELQQADLAIRHEARSLSDSISEFSFIVSLNVWYDVLFSVNVVSKSLQAKSMEFEKAISLMDGCLSYIQEYRESGFDEALIKARETANLLGVPAEFPATRVRRRRRMFDYKSRDKIEESPEEMFKREFFYTLMDSVIVSIEERFTLFKDHSELWGFLYDIKKIRMDLLHGHCMNLENALTIGEDSDINSYELFTEIGHLKTMLPQNVTTPMEVLQFFHDSNIFDAFPNTWVALRILLTLPVTVASGERSFSKLKLIKTYLRATMGDDRLNSLAILSIENELAHSLDASDVIKQFAEKKIQKSINMNSWTQYVFTTSLSSHLLLKLTFAFLSVNKSSLYLCNLTLSCQACLR